MDTVSPELETRFDPLTNAANCGMPRAVRLRIDSPPDEKIGRVWPIPRSYKVAEDEVPENGMQLLDWLDTARSKVLPGLVQWLRCGAERSSATAEFTIAEEILRADSNM